jgi:excisionase family DNA binding protein
MTKGLRAEREAGGRPRPHPPAGGDRGVKLADIDSDMLTVPEVARVLRIGTRQAYQAVDAGKIRAVRIGRAIRVPRAVVERLLRGEDQAGSGYVAPLLPRASLRRVQ